MLSCQRFQLTRLYSVISMAYGRPFMIPVTQNLNLPQAIDDELLTSYPNPPATQPPDKPSHMAFFVHTLQLYEIMGEILTTLYSTGTRRLLEDTSGVSDEQQRATNLSSIIRLEMALDTWEKGLPWFLRLGTYTRDSADSPRNQRNKTDNILLRQNNVLRARYVNSCPLFMFVAKRNVCKQILAYLYITLSACVCILLCTRRVQSCNTA